MVKKFRVYGIIQGSKYLGEFEVESKEAAEELAAYSEEAGCSLCWQCSSEVEDAEIQAFVVEGVE